MSGDYMQNLGKLLLTARKLNNIGRWANEFLHQRPSVAEHSFFVSQLAQLLGVIEEQHGTVIDWKKLYRKAINHDIPEALVGDVISTTKNINKDVKQALDLVEKTLVEDELLNNVDEPFKKIYREIIFDGKDDTIEGIILTCADNLDALMECIQEIKLSNTEPFLDKYKQIFAKIENIGLYSSKYFIKNILPSLINDCALLNGEIK